MAHSTSAEKRHRQSLKRRERNRAVRTLARSSVRKAFAVVGSSPDAAGEVIRQAVSVLDRAVKKGVLHPNNAARRKSRLMVHYNAALAVAADTKKEAPPPKSRSVKAKAPVTKAPATAKASATAKKSKEPQKAAPRRGLSLGRKAATKK